MHRYCIETSVIIAYLRGKADAVELVNNLDGEVVSSFVCLSELFEGIYRVKEREQAREQVLKFFIGLSQIYGLDQEISEQFGKLRAMLKEKGNVIEDMDLLIAATCTAYDLVLVTLNTKHFQRVPNIKLYS